jgi:hypothetical protein
MIGGVTKFIPSTGVTLPLVSYGGSSVFSTLIMFAIIQGLYILREDEEKDIERKKEWQRQEAEKRKRARHSNNRNQSGRSLDIVDLKKNQKTENKQAGKQQRIR